MTVYARDYRDETLSKPTARVLHISAPRYHSKVPKLSFLAYRRKPTQCEFQRNLDTRRPHWRLHSRKKKSRRPNHLTTLYNVTSSLNHLTSLRPRRHVATASPTGYSRTRERSSHHEALSAIRNQQRLERRLSTSYTYGATSVRSRS